MLFSMDQSLGFRWISLIFLFFLLNENGFLCLNNGVEIEEEIFKSLQENIPKFSPPLDMKDRSVYLYTDLVQILSINEKEGVWEVKLWISVEYLCEKASWNSTADSKDLPFYLAVPQGTFWKPEIGEIFLTHLFWFWFDRFDILVMNRFDFGYEQV